MEQLQPVSRLAILGDLHLGRGDATTGYFGQPAHACLLLSKIAEQADLVVINGDLYDLDRGRFPTAQFLEYQHLQPTWASVEACIQRHGIRITAGNHDHALLGRSVGGKLVREAFEIQLGEVRVRIEHGERFDAWIKRNRAFTSAATWLSGWLSRHGLDKLYRGMRRIEAWSTRDQNGGQLRRAAQWLRTQQHLDLLVMGHTHQRCAHPCGAQWLLNPGDAMHPVANYLLIDADQRTLTFYAFDEDLVPTPVRQLALSPRIGKALDER